METLPVERGANATERRGRGRKVGLRCAPQRTRGTRAGVEDEWWGGVVWGAELAFSQVRPQAPRDGSGFCVVSRASGYLWGRNRMAELPDHPPSANRPSSPLLPGPRAPRSARAGPRPAPASGTASWPDGARRETVGRTPDTRPRSADIRARRPRTRRRPGRHRGRAAVARFPTGSRRESSRAWCPCTDWPDESVWPQPGRCRRERRDHPKDRSGGGVKRLDAPGAKAVSGASHTHRIPQDPSWSVGPREAWGREPLRSG